MYPKLGAIPTSTGAEGEAGEDHHAANEYGDEGQEHFSNICKKWQGSCSMTAIVISMIFTIICIFGGGFLYHYLTNVGLPEEVKFTFSANDYQNHQIDLDSVFRFQWRESIQSRIWDKL